MLAGLVIEGKYVKRVFYLKCLMILHLDTDSVCHQFVHYLSYALDVIEGF